MTNTNLTTDPQGNVVCAIHLDATVMNRFDECDECLDDAHEASILSRSRTEDAMLNLMIDILAPARKLNAENRALLRGDSEEDSK